jgi:DNA-binding FrmR family transcriptional regulator
VAHTIREKQKLLNRVRRIRGQVEAVERALEGEIGCSQVMHLVAACRGAVNGLLAEILEDHIRTHLVERDLGAEGGERHGVEDLVEVVHSYFK